MGKSIHLIGQPIYLQIIKLLDRPNITQIIRQGGYDRYTKQFDSYTHLVTYLYAVLSKYDSIREIIAGLLSNC